MTLQDWFYILGIAYIVSWMVILVAIVAVGILAYHRYQKLKKEMATRGALFFATTRILKQLPMERIAPIVAAIPLATKFIKMFTDKKSRS